MTISIPEMNELEFTDKSHTYRLEGVIVPSVTTIMKPLSIENYKGISDSTLSVAADKGTAVHNAIENFIKYDITDVPTEHKAYFDAFIKWVNTINPEIVNSEIKAYHKILRYAGTIDLVCYIDGKLTLVDFKTTYNLSEMLCGVQLEAYSKALESHGINVEQKMILQLKKDGSYKIESFPANDVPRWRVFGALKCVYDYIQSSQ